jgi:DNA-binding NarL/FixJ family response regulator
MGALYGIYGPFGPSQARGCVVSCLQGDTLMNATRTLLIVDGHERVRAALMHRLQRALAEGVVVSTGDLPAATRAIQELAPDAILYDPRTVRGDPRQTLHTLSQSGSPVVILTSSLQDHEEPLLRQAGAAALLYKGMRSTEVLDTIEHAIACAPAHVH